jgi:spermidine/putrescine transport system permease protein
MTQFLYLLLLSVPVLIVLVMSFNNPKRKSTRVARSIYLSLIFIFFYIPIVVLAVFSFNSARTGGIWEGFSFKWYEELLKDEMIMKAVYNTVIISFLASTAATVLGSLAAVGIFYMKQIPRSLLMNITYLPVLNADIITGISLLLLFNLISLPLGYLSIIIAHICVDVPYVILSVMPKLKQMDNNLYEAALDLGSTPFTALRKVIFPEILPGIISGFLLSITMSVDDFVVSFFTSGPLIQTLSIDIYSMTKRGVSPKINALSTILFFVVLSVLIFTNLRNISQKKIKKEKEKSFV